MADELKIVDSNGVEYVPASRIAEACRETRAEDDADFLKLVRQLASMNATVENLVEAIIEDVGYGAHRVDRLAALEAAISSSEGK